jgi:phage-related protein
LKSPTAARYNVAVPRKSIIINTGGPYFPLLNSWYAYHDLSPADDPQYTVQTLGDLDTCVTRNESEKRLLLDDSDPMKNIRRVVMFGDNSRADLATLKMSGTSDDAFDGFTSYKLGGIQAFYDIGIPYVNMGFGLKKIGDGLKGKFAYYINIGGGQPFSKLTRDRHLGTTGKFVGDNHHEIVVEIKKDPCATSVLSGNTFTTTNYDLEINFNRTAFQIIDIFAMITKDYKGYTIDARPIGNTNTEYYKIDTGRWVDAFFNGTDLSERDGRLASANYITAAPNTASGWYSPKAPMCGFTFEDVYVYHRIGLLADTPVANEYTWVPFLGPNMMVPIGWIPSQDAWWSVLGTDDMKMGLEYLYGGIFMAYKETILKLKGLSVVPALLGAKMGIPENRLKYLFDQCNDLDEAWADVDLRRIDDIAENILAALSDKGEGIGGNLIENPLAQAANMSNLAYSIVAKDEDKYSYIDTGLDTSGSDLTVGSIGDLLKDLIKTNIRPTISFLSQKVREMLKWMGAVKKRVFDSALSIANNIFDAVETSLTGICGIVNDTVQNIGHGLEFLGGSITNVSIEANQTITNAVNDVAGWTTRQIEAVSKGAQAAVTQVITFINGTVLNAVKDGINFLADGIINVTNFVRSIGQTIGQNVQLIGAVIGATMILGGAAIAATTLGAGLAFVGAGFGVIVGSMFAGSAISTAATNMANAAATSVNGLRNQATGLITSIQNGSQSLIDQVNGVIQGIANYTVGFVGMAAGAATSVAQFATGLGAEFGNQVKSFGAGLASGTGELLGGVTDGLDKAYTWTQRGFEAVVQSNKEMIKTIITVVKSNIQNVLSLVKLAMTIIEQVSQIFENLVDKVNSAFDTIGNLFSTVTGFLLDLAGTGLNLAIDFSKDVTTQLAAIENQIKSATGFYATSESLFEEIQKARVAASLIEYASQTLGTTKEIFYKWVDVIKPLSIVKGGDSSFRVFQMGNFFAEKLYFVTVYQGQLVNVDLINLAASRLPEGSENPPGGILEASIPVYSERLSNGTAITGLYYSSFTPSTAYEWYGEDKETPYVNIAPTPGRYLARVDTNLTTKVTDPHAGAKLDNFWMEETVLISPEFSVDAFPVVDVLSTYPSPITPGTQTPLRLSILNEMFSKPVASISISISTDTGFVIASRTIGNIVLPSDDEGTQIFDLSWTPVSNTPPGKYDLLVTVTEQNGDTTTKILKVEIASTGILSDILGWFVGIISSIFGFFGISLFIVQRRKSRIDLGNISLEAATKTLSSTLGALRSVYVDAPASCSVADMESGSCSVNGIGLDCDPSTRKCKMKF